MELAIIIIIMMMMMMMMMTTTMMMMIVECRWWNDGWTVKTVVTGRWSASMIPYRPMILGSLALNADPFPLGHDGGQAVQRDSSARNAARVEMAFIVAFIH